MKHLLPLFSFKSCESAVLYIILLEVTHNYSSSCFCKMAQRSKAVGPCCSRTTPKTCWLYHWQQAYVWKPSLTHCVWCC